MRQEWRERYWSEFRNYLQQEGIQLQARPIGTGDRERFQAFDIGRPTFFLEACFYERSPETGVPEIVVRLRMSQQDGPAHYHLLKRDSDAIARELGEAPEWSQHPNPRRNLNLVYLVKSNVDVTDEIDWPNQHAWLASKLEKFNKVFRPRIMTLNAAGWESLKDEDEA